jgi:16S rRNA (uracil1498-N3)-methyltransferase
MRIPRIFHPLKAAQHELAVGAVVQLCDDAANHVGRVLRMQVGAALQLFTGDGNNYQATIVQADKRHVQVRIDAVHANPCEAPVAVHLGQGISRGERMDFVLQKSVELGVSDITPLFTERCGVKLNGERLDKKQQQWQKIVIAACEQSGRSVVPVVHQPQALAAWLAHLPEALRLTLDPHAATPLKQRVVAAERIQLLIGPEGGLSDAEVSQAQAHDFAPVRLGPRVLRTETAALAALTVIQYQFGDLA